MDHLATPEVTGRAVLRLRVYMTVYLTAVINQAYNPLPTIENSLKQQKSLYKVLTPSIKPPYKFLWELMTHICVIGW